MLFKCTIKNSTAEFVLDGYIGTWDTVNSKEFRQQLDALPISVTEINVKINSGGGDVLEGMAIYDMLKNSGKTIKTECYGLAASFGFVLLMAGEKRSMAKNSTLMCHRVSVGAMGDAEQIKNLAEVAEKLENRIKGIIVEQTGQTAEVVDTWFKTGIDKWFDSTEAIDLGIVQDITGEALPEQINPSGLTVAEVYNKFYNKNIQQKIAISMKKEILEKLGLAEGATTEQIEAAVANTVEQLNAANASLSANLEEQSTQVVNSFVESGRIKKEDAEKWVNTLKKNYKEGLELLNSIAAPAPAPAQPISIKNLLQGNTKPEEDRENWSHFDWLKNDSKGFQSLTPEEKAKIKAFKKG